MCRRQPTPALFPYTTLFRSRKPTSQGRPVFLIEVSGEAPVTSIKNTDRKSTRLNSSHLGNSYAVFCLQKNTKDPRLVHPLRPPHQRDRDRRLNLLPPAEPDP